MAITPVSPGPIAATAMAIRARLEQVFPPAQFEHAFVPARLNAAQWKKMTRRTPFVGVGWNKITAIRDAGREWVGASHWTVFLVTRNAGGEAARYFGDKLGPGLFQVTQAAVVMLNGWTAPGIGTATATEAGNLYAEGWDDDESVLAGVELVMPLTMKTADAIAGVETFDFLSMQVAWNWLDGPQFTDTYPEGSAR